MDWSKVFQLFTRLHKGMLLMLTVQPSSSLLLYSFLHMQYKNPMPHQLPTPYTIFHQKFTVRHAFEVVFASYYEPLYEPWRRVQQSLVLYMRRKTVSNPCKKGLIFLQTLLQIWSKSDQPLYQRDSSFRKKATSLAEYKETQIKPKHLMYINLCSSASLCHIQQIMLFWGIQIHFFSLCA